MDARKVLEVLREIEWSFPDPEDEDFTCCPICEARTWNGNVHGSDCRLAALLAAAEHEVQTGGWKPGTEPPGDSSIKLVLRFESGPLTFLYLGSYVFGRWRNYQTGLVDDDVRLWRDLPPLPE